MNQDFFTFVAPTVDGPALVGLDREQAAFLRDKLDEWLARPVAIDLFYCERCSIYVMFLENHECQGVM